MTSIIEKVAIGMAGWTNVVFSQRYGKYKSEAYIPSFFSSNPY